MFKRKKASESHDVESSDDAGEEAGAQDSTVAASELGATTGPWDPADLDEQDGERPRLDLGAIRVPIPDLLELRLEVDEQGNVGAAVLADEHSTFQLSAFAAARRSSLWDDVRAEIAQALTEQGVKAEEIDGTLGLELHAYIPTGDPKGTTTPARFVGADGPRWFLRGLLTGPAALDDALAKPFEDVFRGVVVIRGAEAMAPRDPLVLRLPPDAKAQAPSGDAAYEDLDPFERGPEITEIH